MFYVNFNSSSAKNEISFLDLAHFKVIEKDLLSCAIVDLLDKLNFFNKRRVMKQVYAVLMGGFLLTLIQLSAIDKESLERSDTVTLPLFETEEFETELSFLQDPSLDAEEIDLSSYKADLSDVSSSEVASMQDPPPVLDSPDSIAISPSAPQEEVALLNREDSSALGDPLSIKGRVVQVDLAQAFRSSPVIYSVLIGMSIFALALWLYAIAAIRVSLRLSPALLHNIQIRLGSHQFEEALLLSQKQGSLICKMLACGIPSRKHGLSVVIETMQAEAKRSTISFWQKIGLLSDIAVIAPLLGLLGTVLGMFYAFYDVNRSIESIATLFDGLGVSVGTTVGGLVVAILALILQSSAKYKLVKSLARIEREATQIATLIDDTTPIQRSSS